MDVIIDKFGLIIFSFFFLSMAVESILEGFRGVLSWFGITVLQSKGSLDSALAEAADFVPENSKAHVRIVALAEMVKKQKLVDDSLKQRLEALTKGITSATDDPARDTLVAAAANWLTEAAAPIKAAMEQSERTRVMTLRVISAILGVAIAIVANFDVFAMAEAAAEAAKAANGVALAPVRDPLLGYMAVGLASAGGSSYWHDWLDRVRKLKDVSAQLAVLKT